MAARTIDPNKAALAVTHKEVDERVAGLVDLLAQEKEPVQKPIQKPVQISTQEMSEAIIRARQISLPVLQDITVSIQTLGSDIYVIDGKVQPIPQGNLVQFFGQYITGLVTQSTLTGRDPAAGGVPCSKNRCSRRIQADSNGKKVINSGYQIDDGLRCIRTRCSAAKPTRRIG